MAVVPNSWALTPCPVLTPSATQPRLPASSGSNPVPHPYCCTTSLQMHAGALPAVISLQKFHMAATRQRGGRCVTQRPTFLSRATRPHMNSAPYRLAKLDFSSVTVSTPSTCATCWGEPRALCRAHAQSHRRSRCLPPLLLAGPRMRRQHPRLPHFQTPPAPRMVSRALPAATTLTS